MSKVETQLLFPKLQLWELRLTTQCYWLEEPLIMGSSDKLTDGSILVIGSGISGVSCAYWLAKKGLGEIRMIDFEAQKAASFRNCGHILTGTVESMAALSAIHGKELAKELWQFSLQLCKEIEASINSLGLECEYKKNGYLCVAIDEVEDQEIKDSIQLLNSLGFDSQYYDSQKVASLGLKEVCGARFDPDCAKAHPVKFRNGILRSCLEQGVQYFSNCEVREIVEKGEKIGVKTPAGHAFYDIVVIASNAYSPLFSDFFKAKKIVEPFRGQIITSAPLKKEFPIKCAHSFDHGYEYGLITEDQRLMIGGWRNHVEGGERNSYELNPNPLIEKGLKDFTKKHYQIDESIKWDYSWSGIMASSQTGLPFVGPCDDPRVFTCAGFTGHGFSWAHGCGNLLADIVAGNPIPSVAKYFNPRMLN